MNIPLLKKFVDLNMDFFSKRKKAHLPVTQIFVDAALDEYAVSVVMKIASVVSEVLNGEMIVLPRLFANKNIIKIIQSFVPYKVINVKKMLITGLIFNFKKLIQAVIKINTGEDLLSLADNGIPIGIYIYDAIIRTKPSTIGKLSFYQKIIFVYNLLLYYSILRYFDNNSISFAILPDPCYKNGFISGILKNKTIPSIVGIDVNGIEMHIFKTPDDYVHHCRTPDKDLVEKVMDTPTLYSRAENYLEFRILGQEQQHDVIRAYAKDKIEVDRSWLVDSYHLDPCKKIVLVMSHILRDAPHAYPNMLFKDYEDWLIKTCVRLSQNPNINFLVKEHPSAPLYKEDGLIDKILKKHNFESKLLPKNVNTKSLFNSVDVVLTCGGTAGMEFPCYGVPVLVAAKPPYASFPYIRSPNILSEYYLELDRIHTYKKLSEDHIRLAKSVLYVMQEIMKVKKSDFGLGSQDYFMGCKLNLDLFMEEMTQDCIDGVGYDALVSAIKKLLYGKDKNLVDYSKLVT